jgi:hypothetical protein
MDSWQRLLDGECEELHAHLEDEGFIVNITTPYVQTHSAFWLACLDPEWHERTCSYWYTVTSGARAHTAFRSAKELMTWLSERGLKLMDTLPGERGIYKAIRVEGTYREASYMDTDAFNAIIPLLEIAELSNGHYTLGKVTEDEQGIRTVHYLNPNVIERIVFS